MLDQIDKLVVKAVDESGGYGMLIGPASTRRASARSSGARSRRTRAIHRTADDRALAPPDVRPTAGSHGCHVDLRPFVLCGADGVRIVPGGLTRTRAREGSLVVNSSQGGGSKDTWVLGAGC